MTTPDSTPDIDSDRPADRRLVLLLRGLAMVGPVAFLVLFAARAVNPADPILLVIAAAMAVTTVGVVAGVRLAAWAYPVFPIAVFTTPALRELSFNLSAVDSDDWRLHAIASLVSLGWATVTALAVAFLDRGPSGGGGGGGRAWLGATGGGLALGLVLLLLAPIVQREPGHGRDLSDEELAALPVIDLLNYRYEPGAITVAATGIQRFRLDNPSDLPHTVTIDTIDVEVWVPAGRWAVLEFDAGELSDTVAFYCSVGDHRDLGMSGLLTVGS